MPPEILDIVMSYVYPDLGSLWCCCLVNKDWNSIASSLLWRGPSFNSKESYMAFREATRSNPQVRQYVRVFAFEMYKYRISCATEICDSISYFPNLEKISLPYMRLPSISTTFLSQPTSDMLTGLKKLHYRLNQPSASQVLQDFVGILSKCTNLEELSLDLYTNFFLVEDLNLSETDCWPYSVIKSLTVKCIYYSSHLVEALLTRTPKLEHLSLTLVKTSPTFMDCLLKHCSQLKSLSIELTYFDNHRPLPVEKLCHDIARAYEGQLTELKLKFHRKPLIPEAITNLIWENHGSHLTSLDLSGYPITNASLIFLGQSVSSNLKHLNLSKCLEGGLPSLSAFSTLLSTCGGGLRTLQLDSNDQVDDSVAMIIATHCHGLRKLSLRKTTTSNVGLKKILETNGYSLRVLYVSELSVPQGAFKEITHFCPYLVELDAGWSGTLESPQERVIIDEFSEFMRLRGHRIEILTVDGWPNICHVLTIIVTYERTLSQITLSDDEKLSDQYLRDVLQPCKKLHRVHILLPFPYQAEGLSDDALVETAGKNYEQGSEMDQPRTYTFDMRR